MNSIKQFLLVLSVVSITACGGGGGGSSSGSADAGHSAPISAGNDVKPIPVATDTTTEPPPLRKTTPPATRQLHLLKTTPRLAARTIR